MAAAQARSGFAVFRFQEVGKEKIPCSISMGSGLGAQPDFFLSISEDMRERPMVDHFRSGPGRSRSGGEPDRHRAGIEDLREAW